MPRSPENRRQYPGLRYLALVVVAASTAFFAAAVPARVAAIWSGSTKSDFFALWSYGQFLHRYPAPDLYRTSLLFTLERQLGRQPDLLPPAPFAYPPSAMPFFWPLGLLSYRLAYLVTMLVSLLAYLTASFAGLRRSTPYALVALLSASSTVALYFGQSGLLFAALLIGGLRLAPTRPLLSGLLIGLCSYKPQLALLVPVALASAGLWRSFAAAAFAVVALATAAGLAFGLQCWPAWWHVLPEYRHAIEQNGSSFLHLMPTLAANLQLLGIPAASAELVNGVVAIPAALLVWLAFRDGVSLPAIAALLFGGLLATPHAFIYDMPTITTAVLFIVYQRQASCKPGRWPEVLLLSAALLLPGIMELFAVPIAAGIMASLLLVAVKVARLPGLRQTSKHLDASLSPAENGGVRHHQFPCRGADES